MGEAHDARDAEIIALRARITVLEREVHTAAGMLSTTGDWAKKHPQDALDFIRQTAREIAKKDSDYAGEEMKGR